MPTPKVPGNLIMIDVTGVYATDSGILYSDVALTANVQPLDAELTAIAGLTSAANKLPYFTGSGTAALTDFTAFARTILDDVDAAAVRTTLGVPSGTGTVSGTNTGDQDLSSYATTAAVAAGYQPLDSELTALAGLTSAANKLPYFTGSGTAALADLTAAGRAILDDATAFDQRATLGVAIGSDVQGYNSNLAAFALLTIASDSLTVGTGLASFNQVTLAANKFLAKASTGSLAAKDISDFGLSLVDDADAATARTTLGLGTAALKTSDTDVTLATSANLPTAGAVKTYVDTLVTGLSWKQAVRVATTADGTLATAFANGQTVDGVSLVTGNRILLKNQNALAENGIYVVAASGAPSRAADADTGAELINATVFVSEGTTNADTQWTCTNNATITVGSTSIVFAQVSGSGTYTGGTGITVTGNSIAVSDAELVAIAGLTSAADRLPYFTGSGTASLATFTTFGRSLVDDADATAGRTTLGLGTSATVNTGTSGATIPLLNGTNQWSATQRFINSSGITILDTDASHTLGLIVGSNLTANRTLTITTGDASRVLTMSGDATISGTNSGDQTIILSGDVSGMGAGSFSTTIGAGVVTGAKMRNSAALSVMGNGTNSTASPADIVAASDGQVLRRNSTVVAFGALNLASANAVTGQLPVANCTTGTSGSVLTLASGANIWSATQTITVDNATTNAITTVLSLSHNTTGTPAIGLGTAIDFRAETSTTINTLMGYIWLYWQDVTHATRTAQMLFNITVNGTDTTLLTITSTTVQVSGIMSAITVGGSCIATQTQMEAASATNLIVTPSLVVSSPAAAKVWGRITVSGVTPSLASPSLGISTVSRTSTGLYRINFSTNFSSAVYSVQVIADNKSGVGNLDPAISALGTSFVDIVFTLAGTTLTDPSGFCITIHGKQL